VGCWRSGELCLITEHLLDMCTRGNRASEGGVEGAQTLGKNRGFHDDLPSRNGVGSGDNEQ
jgi:hypothetical protein